MNITFILTVLVLILGFFLILASISPRLITMLFDSLLPTEKKIFNTDIFPTSLLLESSWTKEQMLERLKKDTTITSFTFQKIEPNKTITVNKEYNGEMIYCLPLTANGLLYSVGENTYLLEENQSMLHNYNSSALINHGSSNAEVLIVKCKRIYQDKSYNILNKLASYGKTDKTIQAVEEVATL